MALLAAHLADEALDEVAAAATVAAEIASATAVSPIAATATTVATVARGLPPVRPPRAAMLAKEDWLPLVQRPRRCSWLMSCASMSLMEMGSTRAAIADTGESKSSPRPVKT